MPGRLGVISSAPRFSPLITSPVASLLTSFGSTWLSPSRSSRQYGPFRPTNASTFEAIRVHAVTATSVIVEPNSVSRATASAGRPVAMSTSRGPACFAKENIPVSETNSSTWISPEIVSESVMPAGSKRSSNWALTLASDTMIERPPKTTGSSPARRKPPVAQDWAVGAGSEAGARRILLPAERTPAIASGASEAS